MTIKYTVINFGERKFTEPWQRAGCEVLHRNDELVAMQLTPDADGNIAAPMFAREALGVPVELSPDLMVCICKPLSVRRWAQFVAAALALEPALVYGAPNCTQREHEFAAATEAAGYAPIRIGGRCWATPCSEDMRCNYRADVRSVLSALRARHGKNHWTPDGWRKGA